MRQCKFFWPFQCKQLAIKYYQLNLFASRVSRNCSVFLKVRPWDLFKIFTTQNALIYRTCSSHLDYGKRRKVDMQGKYCEGKIQNFGVVETRPSGERFWRGDSVTLTISFQTKFSFLVLQFTCKSDSFSSKMCSFIAMFTVSFASNYCRIFAM